MSAFLPGGDLRDHWFRIGRTEVGTTMLVTGLVVLSWLVGVVLALASGRPSALVEVAALVPQSVLAGEVWRLVTWPFANQLGIWAALNLFFFWMFGTELEQQVGKRRMAWLLVGTWASLTAITMLLGVTAGSSVLAGIGQVQFLVLLLWIMENPRRPFFFGIPAWVVGAVLVGINVLQMLQYGDIVGILALLLSFVLVGLLAKQLGLLSGVSWLPGRARPEAGGAGSRRIRTAQRKARRQADSRAKDGARLDELLDKIGAHGMESLSPAERRELMRLRNRR